MPSDRQTHLCHVFSSFVTGGPELQAVERIRAFGACYRHTILALDARIEASRHLEGQAGVRLVQPPPGRGSMLYGLRLRAPLRRIAPDLLLTYGWGATDAVIGGLLGGLAPIVHHESGFGLEEARGPKWRRALLRQLLLRKTAMTVVPSRALLEIARSRFLLPADKVAHIPCGVDLERFQPRRDLTRRRSLGILDQDVVFGTVAALRPEKTLSLVLRAFARAALPQAWLVVVGDGPCRMEWETLAGRLGVADRVHFVGEALDPAPWYAGFDVFVMSSATEQMPVALLEAMACGLPAICTDVGDTPDMLGNPGPPAIVAPADEVDYAAAVRTLAERSDLRATLGGENRARCVQNYSLDRMTERHAALYRAALDGQLKPVSVD